MSTLVSRLSASNSKELPIDHQATASIMNAKSVAPGMPRREKPTAAYTTTTWEATSRNMV